MLQLLVEIIHDKRRDLRIDQVAQTVVRITGNDPSDLLDSGRLLALNKVAAELERVKKQLVEKCL